MKKGTQISDTEWIVMKVIWKDSPVTANEVIKELEQSTDWSDRTIRTLLNRLVKKKVISYKKDGKRYRYYPIVTENECMKKENKSFLNRVYSGAVTLMFAKFLEEESLSDKEIEELKEILDKKKKR